MKTCDKCGNVMGDKYATELGNPNKDGVVVCNHCAAKILFNLFEIDRIDMVDIDEVFEMN